MNNELNTAIPNLKYNFHDSLLKEVEIGPRREITLGITLYSIYYANAPSVRVRFGAIVNFDSVSEFFEKIKTELNEENESYIRVDALKYDTHEVSKTNNLNFYLLLDCGEAKIHCGKLDVTDAI